MYVCLYEASFTKSRVEFCTYSHMNVKAFAYFAYIFFFNNCLNLFIYIRSYIVHTHIHMYMYIFVCINSEKSCDLITSHTQFRFPLLRAWWYKWWCKAFMILFFHFISFRFVFVLLFLLFSFGVRILVTNQMKPLLVHTKYLHTYNTCA